MAILLFIVPTAYAGSAADDLASAEAEYQSLLASEKRTSTKSLWTQVIASFEDVVDDHPNSPEAPLAIFRQGELYMEMFTYSITLGELLKAEKAFRRVIAGYPDHELAEDSRKKLEEIDELRMTNCLVRVTPETNLSELLAAEESDTTEAETEAEEPSEKTSFWGKRRNKKIEEPTEPDIPAPKEDETPDDPIETIIAEAPASPEPTAAEEPVAAPETPVETETIASEESSPEPEATAPEEVIPEETAPEPETPVTKEPPAAPEEGDMDVTAPGPVIVAEAETPPSTTDETDDAEDESYGIGSVDPNPDNVSPDSVISEPLLLPVSKLPEAEDTDTNIESDSPIYETATPVYTDGLPRPTTAPPSIDNTNSENPSTPVDSLYTNYQEDNGGNRMLSPAAPLASTTSVTGIRYFTDLEHTRIVLDTDTAAAFFDSRLPENSDRGLPPRVYIDVFGAELDLNRTGPIDIDDGYVQAIRWSQYNSETVRVVMDLESPRDYRIFTLSEPNRVVIDILH